MAKPKHVPIRTCVACRRSDAKRGLLRVVRQADGSVCYDSKGKLAGRGAYVCAMTACIAIARKQKRLERSLKVAGIAETVFRDLEACAKEKEQEEKEQEEKEQEEKEQEEKEREDMRVAPMSAADGERGERPQESEE